LPLKLFGLLRHFTPLLRQIEICAVQRPIGRQYCGALTVNRPAPARFCTFVHATETMALRWRSLALRTAANLLTRDEARLTAAKTPASTGTDRGLTLSNRESAQAFSRCIQV
jgi:hypothetical protein